MADEPSAENSNAEENIEVPPIPKETAGAVAGAALGSMMGPAGAVVGGIVGALAGKAASEGRLKPAVKKATARVLKPAPRRIKRALRVKTPPGKKTTKSR